MTLAADESVVGNEATIVGAIYSAGKRLAVWTAPQALIVQNRNTRPAKKFLVLVIFSVCHILTNLVWGVYNFVQC